MVWELQVINKFVKFVKLQSHTPMQEDKLIVLREYDSVNEAEWDKSILEGEGISAVIHNEIMSNVYPVGFAPARLVVHANEKQRAEEVLEAYSAE